MHARDVLTFTATPASFADAFTGFREVLDQYALPATVRYRAEVVFEEIVSNVLRHGGTAQDRLVEVSMNVDADAVVLTIEDDGAPFDPIADAPAPPAMDTDDPVIGRRGLQLVRWAAEQLRYVRTDLDRNRLEVVIPRAGTAMHGS
jgi:anti-sigma regulatory factor (Ser/Thr protein kinase)